MLNFEIGRRRCLQRQQKEMANFLQMDGASSEAMYRRSAVIIRVYTDILNVAAISAVPKSYQGQQSIGPSLIWLSLITFLRRKMLRLVTDSMRNIASLRV